MATRERFRFAAEVRLQIQKLRSVEHPVSPLFLAHSRDFQRKAHVLRHGHVRIERVVLEDHRDVAVFGWNIGDVAVTNQNPTGIDFFQACEHPQRCGLSTSGGTDEDEKLAIFDVEIELVHGGSFCSRVEP